MVLLRCLLCMLPDLAINWFHILKNVLYRKWTVSVISYREKILVLQPLLIFYLFRLFFFPPFPIVLDVDQHHSHCSTHRFIALPAVSFSLYSRFCHRSLSDFNLANIIT
jgi:hypothetical protein